MANLISLKEAAIRLGVSSEQIRRLIKFGALRSVNVGYRVMVHPEGVEYIVNHGWRYKPQYETRAGAQGAQAAL